MAEVLGINPGEKKILLENGELKYDELVLSTGAKTNFFGIANIERDAIPMKTIDDAFRMRNALYKNMEAASIATDETERKKLVNIVIAGGGPTGVEVSGMLAEIKKNILSKEYPELNGQFGEIYIVDGGQNLLGPMSDKSHRDAAKILTGLGVKIILGTHVEDFVDGEVKLSDGEVILSRTLIWAAGITANIFEGIPQSCLGAGKRIVTDEFNKVTGLENIYAIGDSSIQLTDGRYPRGHPQLAQVAIQQGRNLASNLILAAQAKKMKPFNYYDKGEMAIIGRNHAMVDLFKHKYHLKGPIALLAWLLVHLVSLINVSNKFRTLVSWTVAYISKDQSLRMIYRSQKDSE